MSWHMPDQSQSYSAQVIKKKNIYLFIYINMPNASSLRHGIRDLPRPLAVGRVHPASGALACAASAKSNGAKNVPVPVQPAPRPPPIEVIDPKRFATANGTNGVPVVVAPKVPRPEAPVVVPPFTAPPEAKEPWLKMKLDKSRFAALIC